MNWEQLEGKWHTLKGDAQAKWNKLTDEDMHALGGKKDKLVAKIVERYGIVKVDAEKQVDEWAHKLEHAIEPKKPAN